MPYFTHYKAIFVTSSAFMPLGLISKNITFPLQEPVLIFSVVLFVILFSPIVLSRFKIPGIIGLILAGVALGPNGLHILENDSSFKLFGFVGLLYIMFLAGLDLDLGEFKQNRNKSIVFGILTFAIPLSIGIWVFYYLFDYPLLPALLIASMFSTHTLVGYPIVGRLGITRNLAVNMAVGGTIITDTAVLLMLAVITGTVDGEINSYFWVRMGISIVVFFGVVFYLFPVISRWFFKNIKDDNTSHYIFVMAMVFLAAFLVEVAQIEPIVGAFMAGLSLNRLIPHSSALHNKIDFVGNALFIPFFLISVGMLVDLRVLMNGNAAIIFALIITTVALFTKWLAAWISQLIYKLSRAQRQLIFGLSSAHAAATLAIIKAGYDKHIIDVAVLNGTIVLILVTCLVASLATEVAGKKLVISEAGTVPTKSDLIERILVPVENYLGLEYLVDFAISLKRPKSKSPVYALQIVESGEMEEEDQLVSNRLMEKVMQQGTTNHEFIQPLTKVDINKFNGILHTIQEEGITEVVIPWQEKVHLTERLFGTDVEQLLNNTEKSVYISRMIHPITIFKRIVVFYPENAEYELGFSLWVRKIVLLASQFDARINLYGPTSCFEKIIALVEEESQQIIAHTTIDTWEDFAKVSNYVNKEDLIISVIARKGTLSYQSHMDNMSQLLYKFFRQSSFVLLYPEQNPSETASASIRPDEIDITSIQERIGKVQRRVSGIFGTTKRGKVKR